MPRKPKVEKKVVTVVVNQKPVAVTLHPPAGTRKSWYAYWSGLVSSKSTGQRDLPEAVKVVEAMLRGGGKKPVAEDAHLTDEEFEQIQRAHYGRINDPASKARAEKSLQNCLEAIHAFQAISGLKTITVASPDDCAAFQSKALTLPKNTLRPYPKGAKAPACYSPNTVRKWSVALQAAWERACRTSGKKCVRGVVPETKLLRENPWKQFTWVEGYDKPIRQFDHEELLGLLDYLDANWPEVTAAVLLAKVFLWSCARRAEVTSLRWSQLRTCGSEQHFDIVGKWGVRRWFRVPEPLYQQLLGIRTESPYVFAAYNRQLRRQHECSGRPKAARQVGSEFSPVCLGDWFHERLQDWSVASAGGKAHAHVFRKTALQFARRGEELKEKVAKDAGVSARVMMAHYVEDRDPESRLASNQTYERILASLPKEVAHRYGHAEQKPANLEEQIQQATAAKDWARVAELSAELLRSGSKG